MAFGESPLFVLCVSTQFLGDPAPLRHGRRQHHRAGSEVFGGIFFWIIVAAGGEDETKIRAGKAPGGRGNQDILGAARPHFSAEEKNRIVPESLARRIG